MLSTGTLVRRERVDLRLEYLGTQRGVELAVERLFIPLHHYVDAHYYGGQGGAGRG